MGNMGMMGGMGMMGWKSERAVENNLMLDLIRDRRIFTMMVRYCVVGIVCLAGAISFAETPQVLDRDAFKHYVDEFNANDEELVTQYVDNASAWEFLKERIPFFSCPDKEFETTYYFRWWTFRKHLKETPDGMVITEFLPKVPWAGKYNTISCAAGHHFREGRWLHDSRFLDDYARFWFRKGGSPRTYSFWVADSLFQYFMVTGDPRLMADVYPDLVKNYEAWRDHLVEKDGQPFLYWQTDGADGGEVSNGGSGMRPTINSYQYGDAKALAAFAALFPTPERAGMADRFERDAERIRTDMLKTLWNSEQRFFEVMPELGKPLSGVRESYGYAPWYFALPPGGQGYEEAWKQLMDPQGFHAPFGPTTCEQRFPGFKVSYEGHECQWNGPSWPYATSMVLTALANVLNDYRQDAISKDDYFQTLRTYTLSHRIQRDDGSVVPWIDENLNPFSGEWLARARLKTWENGHWSEGKGGKERGKDYNHSTYCDLIISGLVGLRPRTDDTVEINPLLPPGTWDYFCLDNVLYHGRLLTILYDKTGKQYGRGEGLRVFADGEEIASAPELGKVTGTLKPKNVETAGGWEKYSGNPVLGGDLGTCFDIAVLKEGGLFRMWFSWRPKKSIALTESKDGIHWSEPVVVLPPNKETKWEKETNRPTVLKKDGTYYMWYTGQANDRSWIGFATSDDGVKWKRMSDKPVLSSEQAWEKGAAMCPHVLWDESQGVFRMWYSAGDQYEPNAIGYATSRDGVHWERNENNPIFRPDPAIAWEKDRVTACQVLQYEGWHIMFYIGFKDIDHAQIGIARSKDGIGGWERLPDNPIIRQGTWDADACYKPYAILDGDTWMLWYNGRTGALEQIGLATHPGAALGFEP